MQPGETRRVRVAAALSLVLWLSVSLSAATVYNVQLPSAQFGHLNQNDYDLCEDSLGVSQACGPVAAMNSFIFLQNRYPATYGPNKLMPNGLPQDLETLACMMQCSGNDGGTRLDNFWDGKLGYIEMLVPGVTSYRREFAYLGNIPSFAFLYQELLDGEDVELLLGYYDAQGNRLGGHYVTLTGLDWTDAGETGKIPAADNARIKFVDPGGGVDRDQHLYQFVNSNYLITDYGVGGNVAYSAIDGAASESPMPEPATAVLVLSALLWLYLRSRARRSAARN